MLQWLVLKCRLAMAARKSGTDLFEQAGLKRSTPTSTIELKEPIILTKGTGL